MPAEIPRNIFATSLSRKNLPLSSDGTENAFPLFTAIPANINFLYHLNIELNDKKLENETVTVRIFIKNGKDDTDAKNYHFFKDFNFNVGNDESILWSFPLNFDLPAGYKIYYSIASKMSFRLSCIGVAHVPLPRIVRRLD